MGRAVNLTCGDPAYPDRLRRLLSPPDLDVSGPLNARVAAGIAGSRYPTEGARKYVRELAGALARAGAVIVSGGAIGIDTAVDAFAQVGREMGVIG